MTLLIALGVIAVATAATLVSLRIVSQESELQGRERHSREAFFAAEAGMAEGREVLTVLLEKNLLGFTDVFKKLGDLRKNQTNFNSDGQVDEPGFPGGQGWYEIIPETPYRLVGQALDSNVTTARRELRDPSGKLYKSFPEQARVVYRVFVHDDDDEEATGISDPALDSNKAVWVVSVGEVLGVRKGETADAKTDEILARSVVRALVFTGQLSQVLGGHTGQKGQGSDKTTGSPLEQNPPDVSQGTTL